MNNSKGKKRSPNAYRLKFTPQKVSENGSDFDSVSSSVSVSETVSHIKKKNKNIPLCPPQEETGFGDELQDAFEAWLAYKAERRQAYKPAGLKALISEIRSNAVKFGEEAVANLIRECMASNWQGIIFGRLRRDNKEQLKPGERPRYNEATGQWESPMVWSQVGDRTKS